MIDFLNLEKYTENNRIEAKKATGGLPISIWETYSAFANTMGGVILLGVVEMKSNALYAVGVPDPEYMVTEFWEQVNNKRWASNNILNKEDVKVQEVEGKRIILIRVPRAERKDRPIYVYNNPLQGVYRRDGEGDYKCNREEIEEMCFESPDEKDNLRNAIVNFITESSFAREEELMEVFDISWGAVMIMMTKLMAEGIVVEEDGIYRLKR